MYWFFVITFFQLPYHYFCQQTVLTQWAQPSLHSPWSYHLLFFIVTNSMFACFQMYVRSTFLLLFFFNFMIFFSPQTCVDSAGENIFTFPVVIQLNVFIAVPDHFVFFLEQQNFLITRRQCGYLPHSSWKWPENKTKRVRTHLGDKIFSTVAKSVLRSQCLCWTKFVFLSQEHTDIHNTHKHDFLYKKIIIISEEKMIISTLDKYSIVLSLLRILHCASTSAQIGYALTVCLWTVFYLYTRRQIQHTFIHWGRQKSPSPLIMTIAQERSWLTNPVHAMQTCDWQCKIMTRRLTSSFSYSIHALLKR